MSTSPERIVEALRASLKENERLRQELVQLAHARREPIAIVGMSCRFPGGVRTPEELWQLVAEGRDAMSDFPRDRGWNMDELYDPDPDARARATPAMAVSSTTPPSSIRRSSGSARARRWRSIRSSDCCSRRRGRRSSTRASTRLAARQPDRASSSACSTGLATRFPRCRSEHEGYFGIGSAASVASGRIAYTFGLEGPAITVDTAC